MIGSEAEIKASKYRSNIKPQSVLGTLGAFEIRFDVTRGLVRHGRDCSGSD